MKATNKKAALPKQDCQKFRMEQNSTLGELGSTTSGLQTVLTYP